MTAYIARRLLLSALTIWIVSLLAFVIIQLPEGDSVDKHLDKMMQEGDEFSLQTAERLRKHLGLDKPMHIRYGKWMWNMAHGDLGTSFLLPFGWSTPFEQRVDEIIADRLWLTVALTGFTVLVTWTFAIPIGIYSAVRQHSVGDYVFTFLGFSGLAVPDFLLGLVLMYLAFAYLDQSVGGLFSADYAAAPWTLGKAFDLFKHLWIPAIVLGTSGTASLIRIMRNNLLDELSKPYVTTAMAKGAHPLRVIVKYPVRVAINPLVSTVGYLCLPWLAGASSYPWFSACPRWDPFCLTRPYSKTSIWPDS